MPTKSTLITTVGDIMKKLTECSMGRRPQFKRDILKISVTRNADGAVQVLRTPPTARLQEHTPVDLPMVYAGDMTFSDRCRFTATGKTRGV